MHFIFVLQFASIVQLDYFTEQCFVFTRARRGVRQCNGICLFVGLHHRQFLSQGINLIFLTQQHKTHLVGCFVGIGKRRNTFRPLDKAKCTPRCFNRIGERSHRAFEPFGVVQNGTFELQAISTIVFFGNIDAQGTAHSSGKSDRIDHIHRGFVVLFDVTQFEFAVHGRAQAEFVYHLRQ